MSAFCEGERRLAGLRRALRRGWLAWIALGFAAACRGEENAPANASEPVLGPPIGRVELRVAAGARPLPTEPIVVQEYAASKESSAWKADARHVQFVAASDDSGSLREALMIGGQEKVGVVIPTHAAQRDYSHIEVLVHPAGRTNLGVTLLRDGKVLLRQERVSLRRYVPQRVLVALPQRTDGKPFDAVRIDFTPTPAWIKVFGTRFLSVPLGANLPQVGDPAQLVSMGDDARPAILLASQAPLSGRLLAPPGGKLSFAYAVPPEAPLADGPLVLRTTLRGADGAIEAHDLPIQDVERGRWLPVELDLPAPSSQDLQVQIALRSASLEAAICVVTPPIVYEPVPEPASVVLVTSDTHRFDHLSSAQRGVDVATPVLDELAARGVFFENCFSATNVTLPSHIAMLTGRSPRDTKILANHIPITDQAPTLAEAFAARGFECFAAVSTNHLGQPASGLGQGFDRMSWPETVRDADASIGRLLEWVEEASERPVFVWLHLFDAHTPYEPRSGFIEDYYDGDPRSAELPEPEFPRPTGLEDVRDLEYILALYRNEVAYLDDQLARVLGHARLGAGIVAVTADHGEDLGKQGTWWDHAGLYTDTIHVPLILAWPGGPKGQRDLRRVSNIDLGRTLLDLAGLQDAAFPGRSLSDAGAQRGEPVFAIAAHQYEASVTVGDKHLILNLRRRKLELAARRSTEAHEVELFDLAVDPDCRNDLHSEQPELAGRMRALVVEWLGQAQDPGWAGVARTDPESLAALAELGYVITPEDAASGVYFDPDCACDACQRWAPFAE